MQLSVRSSCFAEVKPQLYIATPPSMPAFPRRSPGSSGLRRPSKQHAPRTREPSPLGGRFTPIAPTSQRLREPPSCRRPGSAQLRRPSPLLQPAGVASHVGEPVLEDRASAVLVSARAAMAGETMRSWIGDDIVSRVLGMGLLGTRVCLYLPVSALPAMRRVRKDIHDCVNALLSRDASLNADLQFYICQVTAVSDQRVWVAIRAKPHVGSTCLDIHRNCVSINYHRTRSDGPSNYFFDAAFPGAASQADVWRKIHPRLTQCVLQKENACLLAYGQTGSGKTHTMFGHPDVTEEEGIAYRVGRSLDNMLRTWDGPTEAPLIEMSFLEVYNEGVYDLLANRNHCSLTSHRNIVELGGKYSAAKYASEDRAIPQGLMKKRCDRDNLMYQVHELLAEGASARTAGHTVCNARSSRSHAVVTFHMLWPKDDGSGASEERRLYLVDLAGSERAGRYAMNLEQLKEGVNINRSLSTLARVVGALARGHGEHVPHRDSALTWLLHDAITGRSARAFMIATVDPAHQSESTSTLCYAREYSALRSDLNRRIAKLLAEVRVLRRRIASIHTEFSKACAEYASQSRGVQIWTADSLNEERVVKAKHSARKDFRDSPYLIWTDDHFGKRSIGAVGVVQEVIDAPPPVRAKGERKDGRRRRPKMVDASDDDDDAPALPVGRSVRVSYAGRHGWPAIELWYPETALVDVPPPSHLLELVQRAERVEAVLSKKQLQLQETQLEFAAQQRQWMVSGT
eukprot:TRINITY_DN41576_c0_g1_i1.p1 TRINITY_DN41576_c0_g1~~TRINITY_DN41576_c0_g1_i1.p1  ORF type:complete len:742 (+),score=59.54 TRINITY_DN41576_c0_g1_i1:74-2299(+)